MKKQIIILFLTMLFCALTSGNFAQQTNATEKTSPVTLHRTETYKIISKINGQTYPIFVALPGSYFTSNQTYPVVYMLDAYSSFGILTQMARLLASSKEVPEVIIVGISSEGGSKEFIYNRARDFTPTNIPVEKLPEAARSMTPVSGGAEKFLGFIKEELIPFVESKFRFTPDDRTLVGHSYGGLFGFYTLFKQPNLFKRYVMISPALIWDDGFILKLEENYFKKNKSLDAIVYTTIGSLDTPVLVDAWKRTVAIIKEHSFENLNLKTEVAENETHYSIIPFIATHGLKSVFSK